MNAYKQITDSPSAAYPVVYQATEGGVWGVQATVKATEAEADAQAIAIVESGSAFRARVCKPTGVLFEQA